MWKLLLLVCAAATTNGFCDVPEPINRCGPNQVFSNCTNGGCEARNCSQVGKPVPCVKLDPKSCRKGCVCAPGYLRTANGICVPKNQCNEGCGGDPNAQPGCGYNCRKKCSDYKSKLRFLCPTFACKPDKCDCKPGYVLDENIKKCVLPKQCTPICKLNEKYSSCINGGCGYKNCSQIGKPRLCVDPAPGACIKGCICADGYLRAGNGTCVPQKECAAANCKSNEVYDVCPAPCPPRRCDVDDRVIRCAAPPQPGDEACQPGCRCADGYARLANGTCVLREQCEKPLSCDYEANEIYDSCPATCPGQSCDVDPALVLCAPSPEYGDPRCKPACRCIDGYVRNAANKCIPRDQCPPKSDDQCPGQNEFYDTCISGCSNQSCDSIGKVIECPIQPAVCREGCRCKPGFYRNADNVCVAESECSAVTACKGQNEYLETCISGCSNQTCDSIGKIFNCPIQPAVCRIGCRCNPGFYRNADNVCVAESECPAPPCPDGETYSRCPTVKCEGDYCQKTRDSPTRCPVGIVCDPPRCVCAFGRRRDHKTGKCIQAQDCPPFKCDGPNEEYLSCPATCPSDKCSDYVAGKRCPPFIIGVRVPCAPQCRCKEGYYRNDDGTCVLASQCAPVNNTTTNTPVIIEPVTTEKPTTETDDSDGVANLQSGVIKFNGRFLYERLKVEKGNIITSPYSVITPLVQLALYASGGSLKQLTSVLNVNTKEQIRTAFPELVASFDGQTSVNFSTAAKVYSNAIYPLSDAFKKDSVEVVHADAQELDFSKNTEAADIINAWVESQTNNRIHNLLQASDLSSATRLVLVNAIYFKGDWHYAFNKTDTVKDADFYLSDGSTKKTDLMYQQRRFNYGEVPELNCTVLQLFYKGDNFSMVVVLPNEKDGLMPLAEKLQEQANYDKVVGSLSTQLVKVYLPPFKIETTTDLTGILKQLGVTNIFDPNNSGLSGMLKTPEDTHVSKAVQKAFIEVNEEGTEAAAANALVVGVTSVFRPEPPKEVVFRADRSFLYYIVCNNIVLFAGAVVDRD